MLEVLKVRWSSFILLFRYYRLDVVFQLPYADFTELLNINVVNMVWPAQWCLMMLSRGNCGINVA